MISKNNIVIIVMLMFISAWLAHEIDKLNARVTNIEFAKETPP